MRITQLVTGEAALAVLREEAVTGEAVIDLARCRPDAIRAAGTQAIGPERHRAEASERILGPMLPAHVNGKL